MKRIKTAWSTEREVLAALVALLMFVIALGVVAYVQMVGFSRTLQSLDRSREIAISAEDLYRHLLSAESGARGYLITGDLAYLEPYEQSLQNVSMARETLTRLIAEAPQYPSDVWVLMAQVDSKLAELANTVEIRRSYGFEAAQAIVSTNLGASLMTNIRDWLRTVIETERAHFTNARTLVIERIRTIATLTLLLVLCVFGLACVVYVLVHRSIRTHRTINQGLAAALQRERELNELKTHFIRTVSHEFRTPLAIMQTSTDLLKHYGHRMSEGRREEHLDKLQDQIVRLTALLEDAVTLQKAQLSDLAYAPATHNLDEVCRRTISVVEDSAFGRRIRFTAEGVNFQLLVDADLISRALWNLLQNAIKFSGEDTEVRVELTCTDSRATIRVIDQGVGIMAGDQPHLFDLFYRGANAVDVPGTGLGLSVAKSIVERHQGRLYCQSTPGVGSVFTIELHVSQAAAVGAA